MIPDRFKMRVWNKRHKMMRHGVQGETARGIGVGAYIVAVDYAWSVHVADDEIPMQCTGINDSGGRLVYEGDILVTAIPGEDEDSYPCVVEKRGLSWVVRVSGIVAESFGVDGAVPLREEDTLKYARVIGNIFENPELMGLQT